MKLNKCIRKRLYEASGKPVWIPWPSSAPDPKAGKTYRVAMKEQRSFTILVEKTMERGTRALAKIDNDRPEILHGLKGTWNEFGDYAPEPERVGGEYEARLVIEGRAKTVLQGSEQRLKVSVERKRARAQEKRTPRATRAIERHQRSIERRLAA